MGPSLRSSVGVASSVVLSLCAASGHGESPVAPRQTEWAAARGPREAAAPFDLEERVLCQRAIEQVYARHRSPQRDLSAASEVPPDVVRRKAEDGALKSAALQRVFGVTLTDEQLQAELDRMAARSQAPDVLRELLDALEGDPRRAAECLARPLLADRLIRSHYSQDERFHGSLRARARRELAESDSALPRRGSGVYTEVEWRRGRSREAGVIGLSPDAFDAQVRRLKATLPQAQGEVEIGRPGALREDDTRFYALSVLALDDDRLRVASVEWRKRSFDSWWSETRGRVPLEATRSSFAFRKPAPPGTRCRDDSWKPTPQLLEPRYWHTAVWTGSEMIVFGGMEAVGFVFGDGSRYDPATDTWAALSPQGAPGQRQAHVAVWTGREMVVWGGRGDTTGGRYDPATDTWRPTATANAPAPRWNASVVWTGAEMIVWGGDGGFVLNTGGRYDPAADTWTSLPLAPLAPRAYHAAVWTGSQMVVWGGYNVYIGQMYGDGARYDLGTNTWSPLAAAGAPNARYFHTAVWTGTEMIVWGGINYPTYDLSGGRYNPATNTWTPTSQVGAPSLRWMHAAVWTGTEMVVAGGAAGGGTGGRYRPATDTWVPTSLVNSFRNGEGITAVWTGEEMILWGGLDDDSVFHFDGRRYDPVADVWRPTGTMNVPTARGLHEAVWTGSEMIVWGGYSHGFPNTGGLYDPATDAWRPTSTAGAPAGRENVTGVWTGTEAIFWGGEPDGNAGEPGTGGRYSPATDTWSLVSTANAATSRYGHTAVWTGSEMIVFGGLYAYPYGLAKRYRAATDTWSDATLTDAPGQRDHHAAVWTGNEMIVWGGFIYDGSTPTGGRYNPTTDSWSPTNVAGSPATRMWPIGAWTGSEMIVWGGYDWLFTTDLGDGARYDPSTDHWTPTSLLGAPSPRTAQGVWSGRELLLWGDVEDSSGARYNPLRDTWRSTTLSRAPQVLWGGRWSTVWTGYQMIVWGGMGPTQQGALYCASGRRNSPPIATADGYAAAQGAALVVGPESGVLANDTDANGDPLAAVLATPPLHGTLQLNANGSFTYSPAPRFTGVDSFAYRAFDGLASSDLAQVQIAVE